MLPHALSHVWTLKCAVRLHALLDAAVGPSDVSHPQHKYQPNMETMDLKLENTNMLLDRCWTPTDATLEYLAETGSLELTTILVIYFWFINEFLIDYLRSIPVSRFDVPHVGIMFAKCSEKLLKRPFEKEKKNLCKKLWPENKYWILSKSEPVRHVTFSENLQRRTFFVLTAGRTMNMFSVI
jgi:hypothetical protein